MYQEVSVTAHVAVCARWEMHLGVLCLLCPGGKGVEGVDYAGTMKAGLHACLGVAWVMPRVIRGWRAGRDWALFVSFHGAVLSRG